MGWASMSFSRIISDLDSYLKSREKKAEALQGLLLSGKISQNTFDLVDRKLSRLTSVAADLKETLIAEESFWKANLSENTRILESLLIELELKRLLGEIGEEWTKKSMIISSGLESLKANETLTGKIEQELTQPIQTTLEKHTNEKVRTELVKEDRHGSLQAPRESIKGIRHVREQNPVDERPNSNTRKKWIAKEPPSLANSLTPRIHCMNPWKPECRNGDIGLSIYYKGQTIPICHRCWEDISKKNIEWSSL
jgi:hypothetical protein